MKKKISKAWKKMTSAVLVGAVALTMPVAVNADERNKTAGEWENLKEELSVYNAEWTEADFNAVTGCMPDSALLGNGDMGVVSAGSETQKTYLLTKGDFWNCGDMNTNNLHGADPNRTSPVSLGGITIESSSRVNYGTEALVETCGYISDSDPYYTYDPDGIVDGKMSQDNEEWACNMNHGTAGEHWFIIDLQKEINLKKYEIYHQAAMKPGESNMNTDSYQVLISTDKTDWTEIENVTGNVDNITVHELEEAAAARYIKVNITKPNPDRDNTARIVEMKIFDDEGYNVITGEKQGEFYETQDITTGGLFTEMTIQEPVSLNAWVDQNENLFVTKITSESDTAVELKAAAWTNDQFEELPAESGVEDGYIWAGRTTYNGAQDDESSWTSEAVITAKIIGAEMTEMVSEGAEASFNFQLQPYETVYLIASVGGGGQNYNHLGELQGKDPMAEAEELQQMVSSVEVIDSMKAASDDWWKEYWLKSYIDIGDEELQRYYYGSLYYMGAGSREDALAPGIMGIWTTSDSTMWNGDYHMNYNYIAPFYGMYSSNRYEQAYSLKDPLLDYMSEGERRAKEDLDKVYYNYIHGGPGTSKSGVTFPGREDLLNGIDNAVLYPVSLGPWGIEPWTDADGGYLMQVYNAAFSAQGLTAYYTYTLDEEYMQEIYPFLLANANFYEYWCEREDLGNGEYRYNVWSGGHEVEFDMNAGTTTGTIKNILQCLILAAENGHIDPPAEKLEKWIDMDEHMAAFPIENMTVSGEQKPVFVLSERGDKFRPEQATVNLEFIHPGEQLGFDSPEEWLEAAQNSVIQKEENNSGIWNQINNTPKIYLQAIRSGFDPQYIMDKFKIQLEGSMKENYTVYDGYHGIEKAGGIEFINNMLLQSSNGFIKVFPNWINKDAEFTRLREKGAFVISSEMIDGQVQGVEITSEKGQKVKLVNPWGTKNVVITDNQGNKVAYQTGSTENSQEQTVEFNTTENETYTILVSEENIPEEPLSKTTLEYFLNLAKKHAADGDVDSCVESVRKLFEEAIAEGEAVMADENASREEITNASIKLLKAIHALNMKAADKTDLEMAVELSGMIDLADYVEAGQKEFTDALGEAEAVLADVDALQGDVDAAWDALVTSMENLRLKANKDVLEGLLNEAAGMDLSRYTEESAVVFRSALASARAVFDDDTLSEEEQKIVDNAVAALKEAKDGLIVKSDNTGSGKEEEKNPDNVDQSGNSGDDDNNYGAGGSGSSQSSSDKAAKTGDTAPIILVLLAFVLSGGTMFTLVKRRK